ncbi:MAG: endonuclease/exonuclease/phosphatase family protein [Bacteroidaceae bacterium]|nr:endonuclease/exonuclease/phosphatase family protein [Bacteroidaceae bacterium]
MNSDNLLLKAFRVLRRASGSRFLLALLVIITLCGCGQRHALSGKAEPRCFVSYNIRNGIGMEEKRDLQRIADVLNGCKADVVALQEIDSMTARSGGIDVLGNLASLTGMIPLYAPAINFDGGKYGVGILCREEPLSVFRTPLPGREEQRVLIAAEFRDFVFACTHLSLTEEDRMLSLPILKQTAERIPEKPFFLAGDFNAEPSEPFIRQLTEDFTILTDTTVRTYPADNPDITIDYLVSFRGSSAASRVRVAGSPLLSEMLTPVASDHRPIALTINLTHK